MLGKLGDMGSMMKAMGELKKARKELKNLTFSATDGEVTAKVNGEMELMEIEITPSALQPDRAPAIERQIKGAVNDALKKAKSETARKLGGLTGLKIPGMG